MTDDIPSLPEVVLDPVVRLAIAEDLGRNGDLTSDACLDADTRINAVLRTRTSGIAAGYDAARRVLAVIDPSAIWTELKPEGQTLSQGDTLAVLDGPARSILTAERTMLNFLATLSGTATLTAAHVARIAGTSARITATRKTTPGLRAMQIRAVRIGGGVSHRTGLDDAILVKDNHIRAAGGIEAALTRARRAAGHMRMVGIEVDTLDQLREALLHGPDTVLLDNMNIETMAEAVRTVAGQCVVEASGGITLQRVETIARTGVDYISVGALTHSAAALDIGLDIA